MRREIDGVLIEVVGGNITEQDTEAIVNAANTHLRMRSGVAGAIKVKGGEDIERDAISKSPLEMSDIMVTDVGTPRRLIIHAAVMGEDLKTDEEKVSLGTETNLIRAVEKNLSIISFPALGTGVGGFPLKAAVKAMLGTVIEYVRGHTDLTPVRFVLFDERNESMFRNVLFELGGGD